MRRAAHLVTADRERVSLPGGNWNVKPTWSRRREATHVTRHAVPRTFVVDGSLARATLIWDEPDDHTPAVMDDIPGPDDEL